MSGTEKKWTIEEARAVINQQDAIILDAFQKRMEAAKEIARNKFEQGLPIYVPEREQEILNRVEGSVPEELASYARSLYEKLMEVSRAYQNSTRTFGLLGRKLGHSFSPEIHGLIGKESEAYRYVLFEKEPEELEDFVRNGAWNGLNVTIPYKTAVMTYCDELSPEAVRIGAVNTLVRRNGKIHGYNTDYTGFRKTVEGSGAKVDGAKCMVLGSGGASKSVVAVLEDLGAAEVIVVSRDGSTGCDYAQAKLQDDVTVLVNTTPVGMYPNTGRSAAYPGTFMDVEWVFDVIYNPLRTNFLCQAKKSGMEAFDGLKMLVAQAKASGEYFLGRSLDDSIVDKIEKKLRHEKENIVLIGMPGSGKSTIGQALAELTGRPLIDTDTLIMEKTGTTIPQIFAVGGEDGFRQVEMEVIEGLRHVTGSIISCGGGVVTREENYYALAENGCFVFLNRDLPLLATEGRPLSQSMPLSRMLAQRLPLYRSWCDMEVENQGKTVTEVAEEILGGRA